MSSPKNITLARRNAKKVLLQAVTEMMEKKFEELGSDTAAIEGLKLEDMVQAKIVAPEATVVDDEAASEISDLRDQIQQLKQDMAEQSEESARAYIRDTRLLEETIARLEQEVEDITRHMSEQEQKMDDMQEQLDRHQTHAPNQRVVIDLTRDDVPVQKQKPLEWTEDEVKQHEPIAIGDDEAPTAQSPKRLRQYVDVTA
jgi:chromosome segregation ATPase